MKLTTFPISAAVTVSHPAASSTGHAVSHPAGSDTFTFSTAPLDSQPPLAGKPLLSLDLNDKPSTIYALL